MLWTQLPDEFDSSSITLLIGVLRGTPPADRSKAILTAFNVGGYAAKQFAGIPTAKAFGPALSNDELANRLEAHIQDSQKRGFTFDWALLIQAALAALKIVLAG